MGDMTYSLFSYGQTLDEHRINILLTLAVIISIIYECLLIKRTSKTGLILVSTPIDHKFYFNTDG
jgi:hypothetical protein